MADYSVAEAAEMLGLSTAEIRRCLRAGILQGSSTADDGTSRLSFQDLVLLRRARALMSSRVPPHRIRRAMQRLKGSEERPLAGIELTTQGRELVAQSEGALWNAESQQLLLNFTGEKPPAEPSVFPDASAFRASPFGPQLLRAANDSDGGGEAQTFYERGLVLEDAQPLAAIEAYRQALALDANHGEALINLGRLFHLRGELAAAEESFRSAQSCSAVSAMASFNLGIVLEDLGRWAEAVMAYRTSVDRDPSGADAHFNLARLYERMGKRADAFRHLKQYRALTRGR